MRHHTFTGWSRLSMTARIATVFVSALAVLAFTVPMASAAQAYPQLCSYVSGGWTSVTDEQGVTWLIPAGQNGCATLSTCPSATPLQSPYPGWAVVFDDIGLPWLEPVSSILSVRGDSCTQSVTTPLTVTTASAPAAQAAPSPSPYPGWVVVADDQGVPWLQPADQNG